MKSFYLILASAAVAAAAIAVGRIHDLSHPLIQAIVAGAVVVIFLALLRFLSRLRD